MTAKTNKYTFSALEARYLAKIKEAEVNLDNYLYNSAGVGEHPNIVEECDKLIKSIVENMGALEYVRNPKWLRPDESETGAVEKKTTPVGSPTESTDEVDLKQLVQRMDNFLRVAMGENNG